MTLPITDELLAEPVIYKDGSEEIISNPALFPDSHDKTMRIERVEEPIGKRLPWFTNA